MFSSSSRGSTEHYQVVFNFQHRRKELLLCFACDRSLRLLASGNTKYQYIREGLWWRCAGLLAGVGGTQGDTRVQPVEIGIIGTLELG